MADMNDTGNGLVRRAEAVLRANGPLWELMREASAGTAVTGASYSYYLTLYEQVRAIRPREILECGAGISTGVLAYALMENAREDGGAPVRVTSMEDDRDWFETAQVRLPEAVRGVVDLIHSPKVDRFYTCFRGVQYESLPNLRLFPTTELKLHMARQDEVEG